MRLVQIHVCKMLQKSMHLSMDLLFANAFPTHRTHMPQGRLALWSWATCCKILSLMIRRTWKIEIGFGTAMAQLTVCGSSTNWLGGSIFFGAGPGHKKAWVWTGKDWMVIWRYLWNLDLHWITCWTQSESELSSNDPKDGFCVVLPTHDTLVVPF